MGLLWLYRSLPGLLNWSHNYSKDTYCHGSSKLKRMFGHWCSDGLIAWGLSHYWFWGVHLPSKFGPWIVVNNVTYTFCLARDLVQVYLRILFYLYFIFADANCNDFFEAMLMKCKVEFLYEIIWALHYHSLSVHPNPLVWNILMLS